MVQPDPVLEHWGKKSFKGQLLSLSDMLPFSLSIYLLQVQFSLCFSCLMLENLFFSLRSHDFYFPWRWHLKAQPGCLCINCCWNVSDATALECALPLVHTLACHCLRLSISMHTPKHKFALSDPAASHPWKWLWNWNSSVSPWLLSSLAAFAVK